MNLNSLTIDRRCDFDSFLPPIVSLQIDTPIVEIHVSLVLIWTDSRSNECDESDFRNSPATGSEHPRTRCLGTNVLHLSTSSGAFRTLFASVHGIGTLWRTASVSTLFTVDMAGLGRW